MTDTPISISVITATFNAEKTLPLLLDSLERQTDRDFHHIVIDGGSRDGTADVVHAYGGLVTRFISEPDHGVYDALNKGIKASISDFYVIAGADDVLFPDAIANFKARVRASGDDVLVANVKAGGKIRHGFNRNRAWLGHAAMITSHSVGMLIKKSLHKQFGYYSLQYPLLADGLFIKRACTCPQVKVSTADFLAGEFGICGASNRNIARAVCETWQIQMETGENAWVQFALLQYRLFRYLPRIVTASIEPGNALRAIA